jgi:L-alanine-DL-glutamate epimerase-like enolase superfamily enzyme
MRIERLEIFSFPVPFKVVFRHASASRARAENLIVMATSDCGRVGYGEGCPRDYVTGETVEGGAAFVRRYGAAIADAVTDPESLKSWIATHNDLIDQNPAAFCAVETALLDVMGIVEACPVEDLVGVRRLAGEYAYSAVLGDAPYLAFRWQLYRYRRRGFRDFKIKISGDFDRDRRKLTPFRTSAGASSRVRLDANNLWTSIDSCVGHVSALPLTPFAVEEPLQPGDLDGFSRVGKECRTKIILDESLLRVDQLEALESADSWIVNIRVSKMGGIFRSLELGRRAAALGIGVIVGAQVGETSILTRAGMCVMNAAGPHLVASEGAFGTYLLRRDLASPCLMFGDGGVLAAELPGIGDLSGFGLEIDSQALVPVA